MTDQTTKRRTSKKSPMSHKFKTKFISEADSENWSFLSNASLKKNDL